MPSLHQSYPEMVPALADRYGPPPPPAGAGEAFARILAAALGQALEARKVSTVLAALGDAGFLEPDELAGADPVEVTEVVREQGVALPAPAVRLLIRLARWLADRHEASAEALETVPADRLRDELANLNGVGPATADAILLRGLGRPAYPVDRASYRVFVRHGWLEPTADYHEARETFVRLSPDDPEALANLSAWLDRVGRDACRVSVARCERCPLRPFLPEGGPLAPEG